MHDIALSRWLSSSLYATLLVLRVCVRWMRPRNPHLVHNIALTIQTCVFNLGHMDARRCNSSSSYHRARFGSWIPAYTSSIDSTASDSHATQALSFCFGQVSCRRGWDIDTRVYFSRASQPAFFPSPLFSRTTFWPIIELLGLSNVSLSSSRVLPDDGRAGVSFQLAVACTLHAELSTHHIFRPSGMPSNIGANYPPNFLNAPHALSP